VSEESWLSLQVHVSVWPERVHLGQDRRIESHIGGNGSLQRFPGKFFCI
jgi:hypothetical protein